MGETDKRNYGIRRLRLSMLTTADQTCSGVTNSARFSVYKPSRMNLLILMYFFIDWYVITPATTCRVTLPTDSRIKPMLTSQTGGLVRDVLLATNGDQCCLSADSRRE